MKIEVDTHPPIAGQTLLMLTQTNLRTADDVKKHINTLLTLAKAIWPDDLTGYQLVSSKPPCVLCETGVEHTHGETFIGKR
jgi:hypothetical protein